MNRKLPVASRICSRREENLAYDKHLKKLREIKSANSRVMQQQYANERLIATSISLRRNNKKKESLNEQYYTEIERENRILLEKMSRIMVQSRGAPNTSYTFELDTISKDQKSLNKSIRIKEINRINKENQEILKRIQQRPATYNNAKWAKEYKANEKYLLNISEYPLIKHGNAANNVNNSISFDEYAYEKDYPVLSLNNKNTFDKVDKEDKSLTIQPRYRSLDQESKKNTNTVTLFKKGVRFGTQIYNVEITIDNKALTISASNSEKANPKHFSISIEEGKKMLNDNDNDYEKIVDRLYLENGILKLKGYIATSMNNNKSSQNPQNPSKFLEKTKVELLLSSSSSSLDESFPYSEKHQTSKILMNDKNSKAKSYMNNSNNNTISSGGSRPNKQQQQQQVNLDPGINKENCINALNQKPEELSHQPSPLATLQ